MVYLEKCDVWDEVFCRYRDSFACTLDVDNFVSTKVLDDYCSFLNKEFLGDLKQAKKDAKRKVRKLRKAERLASLKAWFERLKLRLKHTKLKVTETSEVSAIPNSKALKEIRIEVQNEEQNDEKTE